MKDFIKIQDERFRKNTIKRYKPIGEASLNVYFNTSRDKQQLQTFKFEDVFERNEMIELLDDIL